MSTATLPFSMPKPVRRKVRWLRWLVRVYVCLDGLAAVACVIGAAFWIGLGIDWLFEPSPSVRGGMWVLTVLTTVYVAGRFLLGPLSAKLSNTSLALLLERNFPALNESVITTVEAADRRREISVGHDTLLKHTSQQAASALRGLKLRRIFQLRPLLWKSAIALGFVVSIATFSVLQSEAFAFWLERIQLSNLAWPRQVQLSVVGFQEIDGQHLVNVARDDDYQLQVNASILDGHIAPEQVEIRYRLADGRRGRDSMTKIGSAIPGRDEVQLYRYQFKKVAADLHFDLVGGDDRLHDLLLHVVERPQVFRMVLECEFPAYLRRAPRTIPISNRVELPEGTRAVCHLEANKPLQSVRVHDPATQLELPVQINGEKANQVSFPVSVEQEDRVLLITMLDQDGVENREPYRVVLSHIPDQPPEVSVQLRGIGSAITPQARIPFAGQVTDEYGLQDVWFEYQIEKSPPERRDLANRLQGARELRDIGNFDLSVTDPQTKRPRVALAPGQQITLSLRASDAYNLSEQEHVGSSQRFMLDVVTNSELRSLLEKKELALRQRFESIYEKMTGVRELLDRVDTRLEKSDEETEQVFARIKERDRLRIRGSLQNVVQLSYETLGVADGFEQIVGELINNRVDSEELTKRLRQGIAEPLRDIGGVLMPQLETSLQTLQTASANSEQLQGPLVDTQTLSDEVLDAMKQVLDRMLELESYNELVELLRGIVADQEKVQEETKRIRREKLRSLLED